VKLLVCVKRVPMTGGRIVLSGDEQAIETKHLGFAISPHEECGVEEAVRLVEQHGGESVVLTLGPQEAEEQLRDAMAIGIDRGLHLVTDGEEWDPEATAGAILEAIRADEAASGPFDLIFFGNESADSGGYQVGLRTAHALGRPCATGLKGVGVEGSTVRCEQELGGGRDVYELPLPAVVTVLEGLNLPRYPSVPGRMRQEEAARGLVAGRPPSRLERSWLVVPEAVDRPGGSDGSGTRRGRLLRQIGSHDHESRLDRACRRRRHGCLAAGARPARSLGGDVQALLIGPGGGEAAHGVPATVAHAAVREALDAFAPDAWAAIVCALTTSAKAVIAGPSTPPPRWPGRPRGGASRSQRTAPRSRPASRSRSRACAGEAACSRRRTCTQAAPSSPSPPTP
jgi:electron transfer flavoprotein beta subunit